MIVKDIRKQFYDKLLQHHVFVVAACDVDAICTFKILQSLFSRDHVTYTLAVVSGVTSLIDVIEKRPNDTNYILLINCGANISLVEVLDLQNKQVVIFVLDSRRPFDLDNYFDEKQVGLLISEKEYDQQNALSLYPQFDQVYRDDLTDDESADDEPNEDDAFASPKTKRLRRNKRLEKGRWIKEREDILFDYYQFSSYSTSSSQIAFDLAWKLSRDDVKCLWHAMVGLTSQLTENQISAVQYTLETADLQRHVIRYDHRRSADQLDGSNNNNATDSFKIIYEKDLSLVLYRHWTILDSLRHTIQTACHFKSWTLNGHKKLLQFLAVLGLPLNYCSQKFIANDKKLRDETKEVIEKNIDRYDLKSLLFGSFVCQTSYAPSCSAHDIVLSLVAILNFHSNKNFEKNFMIALDSLDEQRHQTLYEGLELYKCFVRVLFNEMQNILTNGQILPGQQFCQCILSQDTPGWKYFSNVYGLQTLGRFLCRAFPETLRQKTEKDLEKKEKMKKKPLILVVPSMDEEGTVIVAGVAPVKLIDGSDKPTNILGQAFHAISERTRCRIKRDSFDISIVALKSEDRHRFFDALGAMIIV